MKTITLTSKNQITIPVEMVRQLGLDKTRKLTLEQRDGEIVLKRQQTLEELWAPFHAQIKHKIKRHFTDEEIRQARSEAHEERADRLIKRMRESDAKRSR